MYNAYYYILILAVLSAVSPLAGAPTSLATDELALLAIKAHITSDPSGIIAANWTRSTSVCSWIGVACGLRHLRVAALDISNMGVTGTITPHLGNLSFLVSLNLSHNNFIGVIPMELSRLRRLKLFVVNVNKLTGEMPLWFGLLTKLEHLNLRNNSFTSFIPSFISNLSNLELLDLSFNPLGGTIPKELGNLPRLRYLAMQGNYLTGPIPLSIFNLSTLQSLSFQINELNGNLPTNMCCNLPSLETISLSKNLLSGPIPSNLSQCSRLRILSLSYNHFSGQMPGEISLLKYIELLYLGTNNLEGTIPEDIGNLENLVEFDISYNYEIVGIVPGTIFNISSLQFLALNDNKLSGRLLREIGNLTVLMELYLESNHLEGVLPQEIGRLQQLETLSAGDNNFIGSIPVELFNMSTLEQLSLPNLGLVDTLPMSLGYQLPNLQYLNLNRNNLHGAIPDSISNCSKLKFIILDANKFTGYFPRSLGNLRLLERLSLYGNNLTVESTSTELSFFDSLTNCRLLSLLQIDNNPLGGTIPVSIGNFSNSFKILSAYNCKFKGGIPAEIGNISSLLRLSLYGNELVGEVPDSINYLHNLQGLYLHNNRLSGLIPDSLCSLTSLVDLELEGNQFSSQIPQCLGNITFLERLWLANNKLTLAIPSSIWYLKRLVVLDLGINSLSGSLSSEMSNLATAYQIILSWNNFSGLIPNTIGKLQSLGYLSLDHNKFEGAIPMSMGIMVNMEALDLSYNNLSGSIPSSLQTLQHLKYFNVSFNALSGEIPIGGAFRNFSMDSFIGNEALCGIERFHVPPCRRRKRVSLRLLFILLGVSACIVVVSTMLIFFIRYRRKKGMATIEVDGLPLIAPERISYYELYRATKQFSESNLLGIGSFSSVYKGSLRDGKVWAIKVFNLELEVAFKSFDVECEVLRNIRHRNLTKVIGSCSNNDFKAVVLEYMPNGSLEKWLYSRNCCLDVFQRLNIMIDVAFALEYLHHGCSTPIVHCDLKPSNVLLDEEMIAHVSDFGIAKLLGEEESIVHTKTVATLGYIAPEYGLEGSVSTRCDVFSYGIILMETFMGKRPSDDMFVGDLTLQSWVEGLLRESPEEIIDANLLCLNNFDKNVQCVSNILELSLKCVVENPWDRLIAKEIVVELQKIKHDFLLKPLSTTQA